MSRRNRPAPPRRPPAETASRRWLWLVPLGVLAVGTVAVWLFDLDRAISGRYYDPQATHHWPLGETGIWLWWYRFGVVPALVLFAAGALLYALGFSRGGASERRRAGVLIMLALVIGPLILTNGVFKEGFGRPRPRQVVEFGGDRPFSPVLVPTFRRDENSFPSGHAAAGFAPVILLFALRRRWPRLAWAVAGGGLVWGSALGYMRIIQGGHFLSDVLWAAGVVYFAAWGVERWLAGRPPPRARPTRAQARWVWVGCVAVALGTLGTYTFNVPYARTVERVWRLDPPDGAAHLEVVAAPGRLRVERSAQANAISIRTRIDGRSTPWAAVEQTLMPRGDASPPARYVYILATRGMVGNYRLHTVVTVPAGIHLDVERRDVASDDVLTRWFGR